MWSEFSGWGLGLVLRVRSVDWMATWVVAVSVDVVRGVVCKGETYRRPEPQTPKHSSSLTHRLHSSSFLGFMFEIL